MATLFHTHYEFEPDALQRLALGMGLAAAIVAATFGASIVSISLMKKGIPETLNTFSSSVQRTYDRVFSDKLSRLIFTPDDLGFYMGLRVAIPHAASGEHNPEDRISTVQITGSNLDQVRTLSVGAHQFTTENFRYDGAMGNIVLTIRAEPRDIADAVELVDASSSISSVRISTWTFDQRTSVRAHASSTANGTKSTTSAGGTASVATAPTADSRLREQKQAVFAILKAEMLALDLSAERAFREETFAKRNSSVCLKVLRAALFAPSLTDGRRRGTLKQLLLATLFQEQFIRIDELRIEKLLDPANSMDRINDLFTDPRGPCFDLVRSSVASAQPVRPQTQPADASGGAAQQPLRLRPAEYREVFRSEEPFRECLSNQSKILVAAEAAARKGENVVSLDIYALVRMGLMVEVLNCPAAGQYKVNDAGGVEVSCTRHGSGSSPSEQHRRFASLFATYEKAREALAREGSAARVVPQLESEHQRQPENPYISYLLGRAYADGQAYERAYRLLKPLSDESPANVSYSYHAGYAFFASGNVPQAQGMLERAVKSSWEGSREELSSRAEYYLLTDRARWIEKNVSGRPAQFSADEELVEPEEKPLRFLEFKQLSEPEYPSQVCLRGINAVEKALGPVLEAFGQTTVRDRLTELFDRYTQQHGKKQQQELENLLRSLAREYLGLMPDVPPVCPGHGLLQVEPSGPKFILQCSLHRDLEPDAVAALEKDTPTWMLKAIANLLFYMLQQKNEELGTCLANQERLAIALAAWDDPRKTPTLADLVQARTVAQKTCFCPTRKRRYRLGRDGKLTCKDHVALTEVDRWLAAWPIPK